MVTYDKNWKREIDYFIPWLVEWLEGIYLFFYHYWILIVAVICLLFFFWKFVETGDYVFVIISFVIAYFGGKTFAGRQLGI